MDFWTYYNGRFATIILFGSMFFIIGIIFFIHFLCIRNEYKRDIASGKRKHSDCTILFD